MFYEAEIHRRVKCGVIYMLFSVLNIFYTEIPTIPHFGDIFSNTTNTHGSDWQIGGWTPMPGS